MFLSDVLASRCIFTEPGSKRESSGSSELEPIGFSPSIFLHPFFSSRARVSQLDIVGHVCRTLGVGAHRECHDPHRLLKRLTDNFGLKMVYSDFCSDTWYTEF